MFAGHFGIAAAVKVKAKDIPLWALLISTQLLDLVFMLFAIFGLETIGNPIDGGRGNIIHAEYSHSVLGALILSIISALLGARFWGRNNGIVIGIVTFSHWVIDFIVHVPDLPLLPGNFGNFPYMGLGLWQFTTWSIFIEVFILILGAVLYFTYLFNHSNKKWSNKEFIQGLLMTIFLAFTFMIGV